MTIMVICAHPDDEIIGAGGTIAKYASQGVSTVTIIFSKGEASHPWLEKSSVHDARIKESQEAARIVGSKKTYFLDLRDGKLPEDAKDPAVHKHLRMLILKHKPSKIFTHSVDDVLYGHHAVHSTVMQVVRDIRAHTQQSTPQVWGFNVWTMNIRQRSSPKLVIDISSTFELKRKALECFKTQKVALYQLIPFMYAKAFFAGLEVDVRYAETFVKQL